MYSLVRRLHHTWLSRILASTCFCEDCGAVCMPACRNRALLERQRDPTRYAGVIRF